MKASRILFFDEIDKTTISMVGGKGANLGEMTKAGFPIPFGFCIATSGYKDFLQFNDLTEFIADIVKDANFETINRIGKQIREKFKLSDIPQSVENETIKAIRKVGAEFFYAVRSSATAEDLAFASFAGQQDTFLNIKGEKELLIAIKNCWASLYTDRAILYRIQNKIPHENVYMSVVVQKMVSPDVSGIMFTADPISGHRGMISIDASFGLGEALVSGLVSPDIYMIRKSDRNITKKTISNKNMAIMPAEGGGTKRIKLSEEKALSQVMKDDQIINLTELGMTIEKHFNVPQDIEWCLADNKLYIVQSRAITTLFPLPEPLPQDHNLHSYFSFNHLQVMTDPISPLGIDILRMILPFDRGTRSSKDYKYLSSAAGRIYIDITEILKFERLRKSIPEILKNVDLLMGQALEELVHRADFDKNDKKDWSLIRALLKIIPSLVLKVLTNIIFTKPEGTAEFLNRQIEKNINEAEQTIKNVTPGIERLEMIYKLADIYKVLLNIFIPKLAPGIISFKLLSNMERKWLGKIEYANIIVMGLEGNITTEMGLLVGDLADSIRKSPELLIEFENEEYETLSDRISKLTGHDDFKHSFESFMHIYGMRAAGEIDIARERWEENPEPLIKAIVANVKTSKEGVLRREYSATIERGKKAAEEFIIEVENRHGKLKGKIARRLVKVCRNLMPTREHPKYFLMRYIYIFKKALLKESAILVDKGHLMQTKDIFYANFWELFQAIENNQSLVDLVEQRKEEYHHFAKLSAPRVLTSEGEDIKTGYKRDNLPEGALPGMPVSAGIIEGIARVITDPKNASLIKGEILVAPFTDPGWTPLFINASGLVMEIGGLLTHGTIVAREYGLPAVVGVTDAATKIKTGQKIRVDGNAGFVIILDN